MRTKKIDGVVAVQKLVAGDAPQKEAGGGSPGRNSSRRRGRRLGAGEFIERQDHAQAKLVAQSPRARSRAALAQPGCDLRPRDVVEPGVQKGQSAVVVGFVLGPGSLHGPEGGAERDRLLTQKGRQVPGVVLRR